MIERMDNRIELVCNDCGTAFRKPVDAEDRDILLDDAKALGWRRFQRGGQWRDACPACVRKWAAGQAGQGRLV